MERARATWTDERLDDLSKSIDRVDDDLRSFRAEINTRFDAVEGRLAGQIDGLHRTLLQIGGATIIIVLATLITVLATRG